jgi:hypothetical protein
MSSLVAETFTVGSKTVVAVAMIQVLPKWGSVLRWGGGSKNRRKDKIATETQSAQRRGREGSSKAVKLEK